MYAYRVYTSIPYIQCPECCIYHPPKEFGESSEESCSSSEGEGEEGGEEEGKGEAGAANRKNGQKKSGHSHSHGKCDGGHSNGEPSA